MIGRAPARIGGVAATLAAALACGTAKDLTPDGASSSGSIPERSVQAEADARAAYEASRLTVSGTVVDADGKPVPDASVTLDAATAVTGRDGRFSFADMPRHNALFLIDLDGYRRWVSAVQLAVPADISAVNLGRLPLDAAHPAMSRLLFAGDMALGRRFLDPDDSTPRGEMPPDDPSAVIRVSHVAADSVTVVEGVAPFFEAADARILNLETPVTANPDTPHDNKQFAFFTLPESLDALTYLGVTAVSLGNNHVYDYLESGVADTLRNVDAYGLGRAGAGLDLASAIVPWRFELKGQPYSLISATSIAGVGRATPLFVADDTKAGAADLRQSARVTAAIRAEVDAGRHVIAMWHVGNEYTRIVSDYALNRAQLAKDAGASVVIAHHPHTIQGFSRVDGMFMAHSMGNFALDQDRLDTIVGYTLWLDMGDGVTSNGQLNPHVNDEYLVRPTTGELADSTLRESGAVSDRTQVLLGAQGSHGWLLEDPAARVNTTRHVEVPIRLDRAGLAHLDLRQVREANESVSALRVASGVVTSAWLGQDLMRFGSFEDEDVDIDQLETPHWYWGSAGTPCVTGAYRGVQGFCLYRRSTDKTFAELAFRLRVRVYGDAEGEPNRDMTVMGMARGDNAGPVELYSRFLASYGDKEFGEESLGTLEPGTYGWTPFAFDVHIPNDIPGVADPVADNPRAMRLFVASSPPDNDTSEVALDDLAVVAWIAGPLPLSAAQSVAFPNATDFLRVSGPPGTTATVDVTFTRVLPAAALP